MSSRVVAAFLFTCLLGGCSKDKAEHAAEIGAEIRAEPERAEAILEAHDMTIDEYETLMFEVASDPELSQRYREALPPQPGGGESEAPQSE